MLGLLLLACGGGEFSGHAAKGPLLLGSSVDVAALDDDAVPTGEVWQTETTDDLGTFSLSGVESGPARLEADGYAFDEVRGALTAAPLTLRALGEVGGRGTLEINAVTHLAAPRAAALMATGEDVEDASLQAESELLDALDFAPDGFDAGALGVELSLMGGDTDGNAWLLAVSAVLCQAAVDEADEASVDAMLSELLNGVASDLGDDGALGEGRTTVLVNAAAHLDAERVMAQLGARLEELGVGDGVPDLRRALDRDGDGTADADDEDADGDGEASVEWGGADCHDSDATLSGCGPDGAVIAQDAADQRIQGSRSDPSFGSPLVALGDLDGDGAEELSLGGQDQTAFYTAGDASTPAAALGALDGAWATAAPGGDTDGDGVAELLVGSITWGDHAGQVRALPWPLSGSDADAIEGPSLTGSGSWSYLGRPAGLGDVDDDGHDDVALTEANATTTCEDCGAVWVFLGPLPESGGPGDASASVLPGSADDTDFVPFAPGDLDGDGLPDLIVSDHSHSGGATSNGGVFLFTSGLAPDLTVDDADGALLGANDGNQITLAHADDLDGDGALDLVALPLIAYGASDDPMMYLWSGPVTGAATLATTAATLSLDAPAAMESSGTAGPSDADGDGLGDLWLGARFDDTGSDQGAAWLFYGPLDGALTPADANARVSGSSATEYAGQRLATAGDLDGDGAEDLLLWRQPGNAPEVDVLLGGDAWAD